MSLTTETLTNNFNLSPTDHVLVVHAHPDDEMSTGALLDHLSESGTRYSAIIATAGEAGDRGDPAELQAGIRVREAAAAYGAYGVSPDRQYYLGLPDGRLHEATESGRLSQLLGQLFVALNVTVVITPGEQGFDGHLDHQSVHLSALRAIDTLHDQSRPIRSFGLARSGEIAIPVDSQRKLANLAYHQTQFSITRIGDRWQPSPGSAALLEPYASLLHDSEKYTRYR